MIFFGISKPKKTLVKPLGMVSCPDCKEEGYLEIFGFARYFHLYWIPMFSVGKAVRVDCRSCETTFKGKKMPKAAMIYAEDLKQEVKTPIWHFTGLGVLVGLISLFIIMGRNGDKLEAKYMGNPQVNDTYFLSLENGYTYWNLIEIEADTLTFESPNVYVESIFDTGEIQEIKDLPMDTIRYSRSDIKWMFDEKDIYRIDRE